MKALFLDCDGVINHHAVYAECAKRQGQTKPEDWVDPVCVALVNEICARTGAVIVISSSWRNYLKGGEGVRDVLALKGLTAEVVGHTLLLEDRDKLGWYGGTRWNEIEYWLEGHPEVTHWAVLEDAACALGSSLHGVACGVLGDLEPGARRRRAGEGGRAGVFARGKFGL